MAIELMPPSPGRDWAALVIRPLIISAMMTCIAAGWVMSLDLVLGDWRGGYLVWIVCLVTLETLFVERSLRLRGIGLQEPRLLQIRLAELGMIAILLKAAAYVSAGNWENLVLDFEQWVRVPESFFDPAFVIGLIMVGTIWLVASSIAADLALLEDVHGLPEERDQAQVSLKNQFLMGAMVLLLAVGAQRLSISSAGLALKPVRLSGLVFLPILYIGLGILLYAQVQLSLLLQAWTRNGIPVTPGMERRWASWSLLFVAGVTLLALFLPAGDTALGLYLLMSFMAIAFFIGQIITFVLLVLLTILLTPCLLLFRAQTGDVPPPPQFPVFPANPSMTVPGDWLFPVRLVMFSTLVVLILLFIVRTYWHDRRAVGIWPVLWEMLLAWWGALRTWLSVGVDNVQRILSRNAAQATPKISAANLASWRRWQARTARERVRRLYLMLVQRAAEAGHPRRLAQTPYEYSSELKSHVGENEDALAELTEAFVEARYGRRDFDAGEVSRLHRLWQSLRTALHRA